MDPFGWLDLAPAGAYVDGGIEIRPWAEGQGQRKMRWANAGRRLDGLIMPAAANTSSTFVLGEGRWIDLVPPWSSRAYALRLTEADHRDSSLLHLREPNALSSTYDGRRTKQRITSPNQG
jgi:hypothetical protein